MTHDYKTRLNRATGKTEPIPERDPGSRLRKLPGTRIYFKWVDFELWRRLAARIRRRGDA